MLLKSPRGADILVYDEFLKRLQSSCLNLAGWKR
jgi:hypothetical protein